MAKRSPIDRLERAVQVLLARAPQPPRADQDEADLQPLLDVADALRGLPDPSFRRRLKVDLTLNAEQERTNAMPPQMDTVGAVRQTASPRLRIRNAAAAIDFYTRAFGARELMRFEAGGQIAHAELAIGNSVVFIGEEAPEYGYPSPEALGGSPVAMHLSVDDADALVSRAISAGARLIAPVTDQFYGDRSGQIADPFGYSWTIATRREEMTVAEMHRRFEALRAQQPSAPARFVPEGFRVVTPYLVVQDAPAMMDFTTRVFGAQLVSRATGAAGGVHAEVRIGDSLLMIGGGAPDLPLKVESWPAALHVYVPDVDAAYERALEAGAASISRPADQEYGERSAGVRDASGNTWYIATAMGERGVREGQHTVTPCLHPRRTDPVVAFLKRAFGAEEIERHAMPDGVVRYAKVRIGDTSIEIGDAHGPYQPVPTRFYVFVPSVDAAYRRALEAGASSIHEPANQPYGHRRAGVADPFGNQWFVATPLEQRGAGE
jgi:PhnB protein